jgi:hypothetical protein
METIRFTFIDSSKMPCFKSNAVRGEFDKPDIYNRFILSYNIHDREMEKGYKFD